MNRTSRWIVAGLIVLAGLPVGSSRAQAVASHPAWTGADIRFMQGMIAHHAQALAMTSLVPARSRRHDLALLGERITASQRGEIGMMRRWLADRGASVPAVDARLDQHAGMEMGERHALMPGMLTPAQFAQLEAATDTTFDRLFLERMIQHHQGALTMVTQLFGTRGAAQESETFRFASDVDADQTAEIARMRKMLAGTSTHHTTRK